MSVFAVRYTHPDAPGWAEHLEAHTKWLLRRLEDGTLLASGPIEIERPTPEEARGALLVFDVASRSELDALLAGDPYAEHGLVTSREVMSWDPFFGAFQGRSTLPAMLAQAPLGSLLGGLG